MGLERNDAGFSLDASLLVELLDVSPAGVHELLRSNQITSICERGEGEHEGQHRLTFFYGSRRARLEFDHAGRILRRSTIDFGALPPPRAATGGW
jgi:hypothetical protein